MSGSHLNPTHDPYISIKQQQDTLNVAIQQNADHPEIQAILRKQKDDLGKCSQSYKMHKYKAFTLNGMYGLVSKDSIDLSGYKDFDIYPQYQMLYVLESDRENPMIIAVRNNKFGIVDKNNKTVIPFIYNDIKMNLSWQTANLFEVSKDGKNYFYVDKNNKAY